MSTLEKSHVVLKRMFPEESSGKWSHLLFSKFKTITDTDGIKDKASTNATFAVIGKWIYYLHILYNYNSIVYHRSKVSSRSNGRWPC